jgi:prepilin-type N-terminal cleavage/methylation domain-containing protein
MLRITKGFTLVELLVVMGIIMILVSVAIPAVNVARNRAKDTQVKAGCNTIQAALEQFAVDNNGGYPGAHWEQDSAGNYYVGPGVIGGLPSYDGANPRKDFTVPKTDLAGNGTTWRDPYLTDQTPNPQVLDGLIVGGYLTDYPPNPFLATAGGVKAQMSNLFLFNPTLGGTGTTPIASDRSTLDWNRYTPNSMGSTMRRSYTDFGRGFFSYIPLNPMNNSGTDFVGNWSSLTNAQRADYYKRCRGYILAGWGGSRMDDSQAKGISIKYWSTSLNGFDFDHSLMLDQVERVLGNTAATGILRSEQQDSAGSVGKFGETLPGGAPNIDVALYGATFVKITGS